MASYKVIKENWCLVYFCASSKVHAFKSIQLNLWSVLQWYFIFSALQGDNERNKLTEMLIIIVVIYVFGDDSATLLPAWEYCMK